MIVGTKKLNRAELIDNCKSKELLQQYAYRLVPPCARHIKAIVDNQKYMVAVEVRTFAFMDYYKRMELCDALLEGVQIKGSINTFMDLEDVFINIDMNKFFREIFREELM